MQNQFIQGKINQADRQRVGPPHEYRRFAPYSQTRARMRVAHATRDGSRQQRAPCVFRAIVLYFQRNRAGLIEAAAVDDGRRGAAARYRERRDDERRARAIVEQRVTFL